MAHSPYWWSYMRWRPSFGTAEYRNEVSAVPSPIDSNVVVAFQDYRESQRAVVPVLVHAASGRDGRPPGPEDRNFDTLNEYATQFT